MRGSSLKTVAGVVGLVLAWVGIAALRKLEDALPDAPVGPTERPASCSISLNVREPRALLATVGVKGTARLRDEIERRIHAPIGPFVDVADGARPLMTCGDGDTGRGDAVSFGIRQDAFDATIGKLHHERSSRIGRAVYHVGPVRIARFDDVAVVSGTTAAIEEYGPYLAFAMRSSPAYGFELHLPKTVLGVIREGAAHQGEATTDEDVRRIVEAVRAHANDLESLDVDGDLSDGHLLLRGRVRLAGSSARSLDALPKERASDARDALLPGSELVATGADVLGARASIDQMIAQILDTKAFATEIGAIRAGLGPTAGVVRHGRETVLRFTIIDEPKVRAQLQAVRARLGADRVRDERVAGVLVTRLHLPGNASAFAITGTALWVSIAPVSEGLLEAAIASKRDAPVESVAHTLDAAGLIGYARGDFGELAARWENGVLEMSGRFGESVVGEVLGLVSAP